MPEDKEFMALADRRPAMSTLDEDLKALSLDIQMLAIFLAGYPDEHEAPFDWYPCPSSNGYDAQPSENLKGWVTQCLDSQSGFIQKQIRKNESALLSSWRDHDERSKLLKRLRLTECGDQIVAACLHELCEEKMTYIAEFKDAQSNPDFNTPYDLSTISIRRQAWNEGIVLISTDRKRGVYVGPMVGQDHRAGLVKYAREKAVELPFRELAVGQAKPKVGDTVRMAFKENNLVVTVVPHRPCRP